MRAFLVESYVPRLDEAKAAELAARLRGAVRDLAAEGVRLRWVCSVALVREETYVWIVAAESQDAVARAMERTALGSEHLAEVSALDTGPGRGVSAG